MEKLKKISVIIPAAGQGKRMKAGVSKQYIELYGKPILAFTLEKFQNTKCINDIILVVGKDEVDYVEKYIKNGYGFTKIKAIVQGGKERQDSVYEGLKAMDQDTDIVLIHDAVRPMIEIEDIERIVDETMKYKACIFGVKVKDTIKVIDEHCNIKNTLDRSKLYAIQTPQAFDKDVILSAYKKAMSEDFFGTDDAMLVEQFSNIKVKLIEGSYSNIKITTQEDFKAFKDFVQSSTNYPKDS